MKKTIESLSLLSLSKFSEKKESKKEGSVKLRGYLKGEEEEDQLNRVATKELGCVIKMK